MFVAIACLLIVSNNYLAFYNPENIQNFLDIFSNWLSQIFSNTLEITSNAVKLNWLPN